MISPEIQKKIERSFPEDYEQENGNYENRCVYCYKTFTGNKHRRVCKICEKPKPAGK